MFDKQLYQLYLQSDQWKAKREKVFKKKGRKCLVCGSIEKLNVHHCTYEMLGNERMRDLVVLCEHCHLRAHKLGGGYTGVRKLMKGKSGKSTKRTSKNKTSKLARDSFKVKMLSGPVKIFSKEEIAALEG